VHETAIVEAGASVGAETQIWHWTHVSAGATIGKSCVLGQNVYVGSKAVIGDNVKIQNNVSIYDNVILEQGVFCGPSVVFTNVYNPRSEVSRKSEYRTTLIKRGATLGANSTVVCGNIVGEYAFIGAGAVVTKDVKPYALVVGVPARQIGWVSRMGLRLQLPLVGRAEAACPADGSRYILSDRTVMSVSD
jgi:UDP-2-acetamido-3-amino-2,3-dideoxy-glucuronate N-acetyltransferase